MPLASRQSIYVADAPIDAVYFIERGMVSLVTTLDDGCQAEVGLVGTAGMLGVPLISGAQTAATAATVALPSIAYRMRAAAFLRLFDDDTDFQRILLGYGNGRHGLDERLARWLLMAHDSMAGDPIPITHELLATMLGVHRPSITVAAGSLQRAGLIRYGAGLITVRDRIGLEAASCECCRAVRRRTLRSTKPRSPPTRTCTPQDHTPARC